MGGPSTNLGVEVLRDPEKNHDAFGYRGRTADGRELISSSVYYRDLSPLQDVMTALAALGPEATGASGAEPPHELVAPDVTSVLEDMISEAITATGKPPAAMTKADRIEVLRLLEDRGAFHIKRAAEKVSARLGVSRVTTYGYLDEVRRGQGPPLVASRGI